MEILKMIIKEMNRERKEKERQQRAYEKEKEKWIKEVNRTAKQPTLRTVEDKEKIEKLKKFLAKHKIERVGC